MEDTGKAHKPGIEVPVKERERFTTALDELVTARCLPRNAGCLVRNWALNQPAPLLASLLVLSTPLSPSSNEDLVVNDGWSIDHLDEIVASIVEKELRDVWYRNCDYDEARLTSTGDGQRQNRCEDNQDLTYGEIEYDSMWRILRQLPPAAEEMRGVFYDLGSASGRAVLTARLAFDFDCCYGIELLPNLHTLATTVVDGCKDDQLSTKKQLPSGRIEFICADFTSHDWSDGAVIFCHSTCFGDRLLRLLFDQAQLLRSGSYLISLKAAPKTLNNSSQDDLVFDLVSVSAHEMSWGVADVFIYRRQ